VDSYLILFWGRPSVWLYTS